MSVNQRVSALRAQVNALVEAEASQPQRLAEARAKAAVAQQECLADDENSWAASIRGFPTVDAETGELNGMLSFPDINAKELWGTRLAFDLLGVAGDEDAAEDRIAEYLVLIKDPSHAWLVAASALSTIAQFVVPTMLDDLEKYGSNWDARVLLAEAAENSWRTTP